MPNRLNPASNRKKGNKNNVAIVLCLLVCVMDMLSRATYFVNNNAGNFQIPSSSQQQQLKRRTLHLIQCVYGNDRMFIDEWEVSFKSVLVNAPLESNLHIHIISNTKGADAVHKRIQDANLTDSYWRNQVTVTVNNMEQRESNLLSFLRQTITTTSKSEKFIDKRLGLGAFLRLFAYKYVTEYVEKSSEFEERDLRQAVYLDVDVVVLANLNDFVASVDHLLQRLKEEGKPRPFWVWGQRNTGFLVMNLLDFDTVWESVNAEDSIRNNTWPKKNDQWVLQMLDEQRANLSALQLDPSPWSTHLGHGYRSAPHNLAKEQRPAGMLHLQLSETQNWFQRVRRDGGHHADHLCHRAKNCKSKDEKKLAQNVESVRNTWGLAGYYVRLSWVWAIYQGGTSRIRLGEAGHKFVYVTRQVNSTFTILAD